MKNLEDDRVVVRTGTHALGRGAEIYLSSRKAVPRIHRAPEIIWGHE